MGINKRKGVSPVIATILMVMITVGLVAFSYSFFMGVVKKSKETTGTAIGEITESQSFVSFDMLSCNDSHIIGVLRGHMGNIDMNKTDYYYVESAGGVSNIGSSVSGCDNTNFAPGDTCKFTYDGHDCGDCSGDSIRVILANGRKESGTISGCH